MIDVAVTDHLLTTTRAVRKRLDLERPVPFDVLIDCVKIAQQAPTASNIQGWHFLLITDEAKRTAIADIYRKASAEHLAELPAFAPPSDAQTTRVYDSAGYLGEILHLVPVHIIACVEGRPEGLPHPYAAALYGSIHPAVWSLMLALRSRGLGSSWTSIHLRREYEMASLLAVPDDVTQVALLPVGYFMGKDFRPAAPPPVTTMVHVNKWRETQLMICSSSYLSVRAPWSLRRKATNDRNDPTPAESNFPSALRQFISRGPGRSIQDAHSFSLNGATVSTTMPNHLHRAIPYSLVIVRSQS
jgi:nitroreductase